VPILSKESWHKKTWGDIFANPDFDEIDWSWSCRMKSIPKKIKILFEKIDFGSPTLALLLNPAVS
jgi:hypothetical protein